MSVNITYVEHASGVNFTEALPSQMMEQCVVIVGHRLKVVFGITLGGHKQYCFLVGVTVVLVLFGYSKSLSKAAFRIAVKLQ